MAIHFLQSKAARSLSLAQVFRLTDLEAEAKFREIRWSETNGEAVCPHCGGLALSRDLGMSHKACWVLLHKVREAMAEEFKGRKMGGLGKVAETDGAYFGGYLKPANWKENRIDRRLARNQNGKRQSLVIIRERNGNTLPMVFKSESAALGWIKSRLLPGTVLNADEAASWDALSSKYEMRRINHQEAYSDGEACTNMAESFFSRIRRAEIGHHHHVSGPYLLRYAQESAWREDARRVDNGSQVRRVAHLALRRGPSVDFAGYYQRHIKAAV